MSEGYDQAQASQAALDFITGLKQYRNEKIVTDQTESEIIEALNKEFDQKMAVDTNTVEKADVQDEDLA